MVDVVNDALGLTQYICQHLNENQAVVYLQAINGLSKEDWKRKEAKNYIDIVDKTARYTKEGNIRDIVQVFINNHIETRFLVANLALCPGFQKPCLELFSYTASSIKALQTSCIDLLSRTNISQQPLHLSSSRSTGHNSLQVQTQETYQLPAAQLAGATHSTQVPTYRERNFPALPTGNIQTEDIFRDNALLTSSGHQKTGPRTKPVDKKKTVRTWTDGVSVPKVTKDLNKAPQLKFVCIAVKSGHDETAESLKAEIEEWKHCQELKVEPVSQSTHSTMFRVQYSIPAQLSDCWKEPTTWPARMSATQWRGNPKTPLAPLLERQYTKKIYIGNLSENTTAEMITSNVQKIYQEEIQSKKIKSVNTIMNTEGLERAKRMRAQNPGHGIHNSACVILTSYPGVPLRDITLKLNHYPHDVRKTVRHWRGKEPQEKGEPPVTLTW